MARVNFISNLSALPQIKALPPERRKALLRVEKRYPFLSNDYYLSLIDWDDPDDPIARIALPREEELTPWGRFDASDEHHYTAVPGCEHKYKDTAVLLINNVCGTFCRFCFRKRLFQPGNDETARRVAAGIDYIRAHEEILNVLLTGGDGMLLSTPRIAEILSSFDDIPHVNMLRIGSKLLAFYPQRFLDDPELVDTLGRASRPDRRVYFMAHFNHPRELTDIAMEAIQKLQDAGVVVLNQTPLIRGVNDDPETLAHLLHTLARIGVSPYYVFQCRPTAGNHVYTVPVEEAYGIFREAAKRMSGLGRRARFVMSHASGKVEVAGMSDEFIFFRYHRAADEANEGRLLMAMRNPSAYWLDDYETEEPEKFAACNQVAI